ncbi:MAG: sulfatase-like hydrolase/transferase [Polyangiales bacterium]
MRSILSLFLAVVAMLEVGPEAARAEKPAGQPNILLIVGDDIGFGDLGIGGSVTRTPNLERVANEGVMFTNLHASPVCSVTRGMLLTGNDSIDIALGAFDYAPYPSTADNELLRPWPELSDEEKRREARMMATYSAMMESQDYHIGILLNYLHETGQRDDTRVIFMSDNGPEGMIDRGEIGNPQFTKWIEQSFSQDYDDIGPGNAFAFELFGNSYIVVGEYKAIRVRTGVYGDGKWRLYDIKRDPGETRPLDAEQRRRLNRLIRTYDKYAKDKGIVPVAEAWNPWHGFPEDAQKN